MKIPTVSVEQMEEVDEVVPREYGITVSRMMENAGHQIADFVRQRAGKEEKIAVYAGTGNNGGDGLAAARRLHLWGFDVKVVLASRELDGIREEELDILEKLDVPIHEEPVDADWIIDALIGYSLEGDPRPPIDTLIEAVNSSGARVVSIDVPSGVAADSGEGMEPHVEADYTVTLALPFEGLEVSGKAGEVWVADISVPPEAYERSGIDASSIFSESSLVRL